ncbi:MAG: hypothetical protein GWN00_01475 [Aliifodinibius sp.]|nr:hypothetical protein [Phycisphaerae bacterium]NIR62349.1 hypothetical protein [candidate division Zixibacteria bacterium]NIT54949.1 hypothetical protein [Fodinibius sp.]NIW43361.1 hypothetical protein [Gammaproteobacteria bacterium]NIU12583.1 hypothetical protein [candidate division Zixibacteria bacterium]
MPKAKKPIVKNDDVIEVYVTKYALTTGIYKINAQISSKYPKLIRDVNFPDGFYRGNEWHTDFESAKITAQEMAKKKLKSLEKARDKINKLIFSEKFVVDRT